VPEGVYSFFSCVKYMYLIFFLFFQKLMSIINKCFIYLKFWGFFCKIPLFLGDFVLPVGGF
jgi:hypothetical protein